MTQSDPRPFATVPKLHARTEVAERSPRLALAHVAANGPVALVVVGVALTAGWMAFLGWSAVSLVRWALG